MPTTPAAKTEPRDFDCSPEAALVYRLIREMSLAATLKAMAPDTFEAPGAILSRR